MKTLTAFVAGLIFAVGLGISGMLMPDKIIAFLDVTGVWDPSLAFVMAGALAVYGLAQWLILKRTRPFYDVRFHLPEKRTIDAPLIAGAAIFGVGWGLAGLCPGPALVLLATGRTGVFLFVGGMVAGAWLTRAFATTRSAIDPAPVS